MAMSSNLAQEIFLGSTFVSRSFWSYIVNGLNATDLAAIVLAHLQRLRPFASRSGPRCACTLRWVALFFGILMLYVISDGPAVENKSNS